MSIGLETLTTKDQSDALGTGLAGDQSHWYRRSDGAAVYEVPMTSKAGMRRTNLKDARKLDLVPSVTSILKVMAAPGLEIWKAQQLLQAALTLPKKQGESLDEYAERIVEDSKAQGIAAASRGKQLHTAIETYIQYKALPVEMDSEWGKHCCKVQNTLNQHGIDLLGGQEERSFAAQLNGLWYGGKIDYHALGDFTMSAGTLAGCVCDFKSKEKIEPKKQLVYEEHAMQVAAYGYGLFGNLNFRGLNVFVGVDDLEIRVHEHPPEDLERGLAMFSDVLSFWHRKNKFGKYSVNGTKP